MLTKTRKGRFGDHLSRHRDQATESSSEKKRWGSTPSTAWTMWEFIAKEQTSRVGFGKLLRGSIRGKENSGLTYQTGFLLKTSQGEQTSPEGWQKMNNLIRN